MNNDYQSLKVTDRKSFIKFIEDLQDEFRGSGDAWENNNLGDFLEALSRYTEDAQGYYDNTNQNINADEASWKVFADIIKGATIYE